MEGLCEGGEGPWRGSVAGRETLVQIKAGWAQGQTREG